MFFAAYLVLGVTASRDSGDRVSFALGREIAEFLSPVDFLVTINLCDLYEALRLKGDFATTEEAVADLWKFNQPELSPAVTRISDLAKLMSRAAIDCESKEIRGITWKYLSGLKYTAWKFLPAGLRRRYSQYFR